MPETTLNSTHRLMTSQLSEMLSTCYNLVVMPTISTQQTYIDIDSLVGGEGWVSLVVVVSPTPRNLEDRGLPAAWTLKWATRGCAPPQVRGPGAHLPLAHLAPDAAALQPHTLPLPAPRTPLLVPNTSQWLLRVSFACCNMRSDVTTSQKSPVKFDKSVCFGNGADFSFLDEFIQRSVARVSPRNGGLRHYSENICKLVSECLATGSRDVLVQADHSRRPSQTSIGSTVGLSDIMDEEYDKYAAERTSGAHYNHIGEDV